MIAQAKAWVRQRAEKLFLITAIIIVILMIIAGPISRVVFGITLIWLCVLMMKLSKR